MRFLYAYQIYSNQTTYGFNIRVIIILLSMSQEQIDEEVNVREESEKQIEVSNIIEEQTKIAVTIVGSHHRYQISLMVFFSFCCLLVLYQLIGPSYYFMNPVFECNGVTTPEEEACQKLSECILINDYTITASNQLYCGEKTGERNLIQSMLGYGSLTGLIVINFLSDYKGRKFSLLIALTSQIVSLILLIIGALNEQTPLLIVAQFMCGFSTIGLLSISYVLSDKLMSKKMMSLTVLIMNGFSALSEVSLLLFTAYLDWKDLALYFVLIPSILLLLIGIWFLVEDPAFLFTKHLYERSYDSLRKIAKINNTEDNLESAIGIMKAMEKKGLEIPSETSKSFKESFKYLKIIASRQILVPILCLGFYSFGLNILYYALNYAASSTGNSYGTNMCLFGIAEFTGVFPLMYLGTRIPRKRSMYFISIITIGFCLAFFIDLEPVIQSALIFFIRFMICQLYALYVYMQVESFPQHIQGTAIGVIQVISQPAKSVTPYLVELAEQHSISPIGITSGFIFILMIMAIIPLKETFQKKKHTPKPQALKESMISEEESSGNDEQID